MQRPAHISPDTAVRPEIRREDPLYLAQPRRMVVQRAATPSGGQELNLFYGDQQISFDDPDLFGFAERLAASPGFLAHEALGWAPGRGWDEIGGMLNDLVAAGVLERSAPVRARPGGARPSPLPPGRSDAPLDWRACPAITQDLTGRAVETGYLELILPVFRVAHILTDLDGRQVGESNVFPPALRRDVPTDWAACPYRGTRYMVERPMNVSALRAMRDHWPEMMAALSFLRARFLDRMPLDGPWTVGAVERLATLILAVVTYPTQRMSEPVDNGRLHPVLSSLFRVTDGLRMTMHQMMFVPLGEATLQPDTPVDAEAIHAYAERNHSFHSEHGVCAGPANMVQEFLSVLIDGAPAPGVTFAPQVAAALDDAERGFDYGLMGLRAYAAVYSAWPLMIRRYDDIADAIASHAPPEEARLADRFADRRRQIRQATYLASEQWRREREDAYGDMDLNCARGLGETTPIGLTRTLTEAESAAPDGFIDAIAAHLTARLGADAAQRIAGSVAGFSTRLQAILRVATARQDAINAHLGRPRPLRPFDAQDLNVHNRMIGAGRQRLPYLLDELAETLGLHIYIDRDRIALTLSAPAPLSAGIPPAVKRA